MQVVQPAPVATEHFDHDNSKCVPYLVFNGRLMFLDCAKPSLYCERMANSLRELSVAQLRKAVAIKERIEQLEKDLTGLLGIPEPMTVGGTVRRRRAMSAAARAKISAAAKARWARVNAGKATVAKPAGGRRTMSAEARKRISEAMKARWAKRKQ
jgi:hypothetical protein